MLTALSLNQFLDLAKTHSKIAAYKKILGDKITPITAYQAIASQDKNISLLESFEKSAVGKYSYLCLDPYAELSIPEDFSGDAFEKLSKTLEENHCFSDETLCRYTGGAVGFMSYDAIRFIENIPNAHGNSMNMPALFFRFYRTNIIFDHSNNTITVSTAVDVSQNPEQDFFHAMQAIDALIEKINGITPPQKKSTRHPKETTPGVTDLNDKAYKKIVEKAKRYIHNGDAFQIVLSRTFQKKFSAPPFDIYRALRITNPSPYMFYIEHNDFVIAGASPEKLISVNNGKIETNPIAGTRPRGKNPEEDILLKKELLHDEKEIAEHMMLVDLGRNDLGAVCAPGSVKVSALKEIQTLSRVMHITSTVEGTLDQNKNLIDALKAVFPAGTLSGAPKIRAMEIIDELEISRRGLYGGAICIIDNQKNLDACIAIRMAILKDNIAYVRAGAGIVFDSDAKKEADETRQKAQAVLEAIDLAEGGLSCF